MILVKLVGGLGNQMHQYAFGKLVSEKLNEQLYFEINDIAYNNVKKKFASRDLLVDKIYCLDGDFKANFTLPRWANNNKVFRRLFLKYYLLLNGIKTVRQATHISTDTLYDQISTNTFLIGVWQAHRTFHENRERIVNMFQFSKDIPVKFEKFNTLSKNKEYVAVHVRRGDYLSHQHKDFNICSMRYYEKAIAIMKQRIRNLHFCIFSDDLEWCKSAFQFLDENELTFVDFTDVHKPEEDLFCMTCCNHFIVANSTFSYWGAFLSKNYEKQIVIAPGKWYIKTLSVQLPPNWIGIDF